MQLRLIPWLLVILSGMANAEETDPQPEYQWLDEMHQSIAESVNESAVWFDDFFATDVPEDDEKARGQARIRLEWEPRSRDIGEFGARVRVRVKLPNLKNRADLILSDYEEDVSEAENTLGRLGQNQREDRFSLALRFKPKRDSGISHRLGVGRRLQLFARSRYRNTIHFSSTKDLNWETSVYYYNRDGFGADAKFTFDVKAPDNSIYRFANRFYYRDTSNDWLWQHELQLFKQRNEKTAIIYGLYVEGLSQPNYRAEEYLVSAKWRQNALREWLFFEVEPFVIWRRDEDFSASYGLALRVEGHFGQR